MARVTQHLASLCLGLDLSFGEALAMHRERPRRELTAQGKSIARDIARGLGIEMKPD